MVRVASCPKCSHEAVMFDESDSDDWARCPECRTYFQIKNASAREIPQLVVTKDEAVLAEEDSEAAKETVSAALETRWDTRRTFNAASTQTIVNFEPLAASAAPEAQNGAGSSPPPAENGKERSARTVADLSSLATWSDLPQDEIEAQTRAEQAGDTPIEQASKQETIQLAEKTPQGAQDERASTGALHQPAGESGDRIDKWFQSKKTIVDFPPVTTDDAEVDECEEVQSSAQPAMRAASEPERLLVGIDAALDHEFSSDDEDAASTDANEDRAESRTAWPAVASLGRPIPTWARPRRRSSPMRTLVMSGIGGIFGLSLGYYALLWISGPSGDFLEIGEYLPSAILPGEFGSRVVKFAGDDSPTDETRPAAELAPSNEQPVDTQQFSPPIETIHNSPAAETGDLTRGRPRTFDVPDAAPVAADKTSDGSTVVAGAPSFSADELAVSLRAAQNVQSGLVTGDFDDGFEVKRAKGLSYMVLCDLAQKATFVDKASRADFISALEKESQALFRATLSDARTQEEVARLVPLWLASVKRKHGGVFFAGRVGDEADKGDIAEWQVDLASGQSLAVLIDQERARQFQGSARPLGFVGWITDRPAEQIPGYTGDTQQAVWAGQIILLE
jgi:hypothetical protein